MGIAFPYRDGLAQVDEGDGDEGVAGVAVAESAAARDLIALATSIFWSIKNIFQIQKNILVSQN